MLARLAGYYFVGARGVVSVVCSMLLSKGIKPFMPDLSTAATQSCVKIVLTL